MRTQKNLQSVVLIVLFFVSACSMPKFGAPTVTPTQTTVPPTPTKTQRPTSTPRPTATPNIVATQKFDEFNSLLEKLKEEHHISTTVGKTSELDPFKEDWAQMNWFQWWDYGATSSEFVFKSKFNWTTASATPEESGCGLVFGTQNNGDYYAIFITNNRIRFLMKRGSNLYNVGKTSGSGVHNFGSPAEAEFLMAVSAQKAYVLVNGADTLYSLSADQTSEGGYGLSLLSGTNKDYGTRCEATDMMLWDAKK